MSITSYCTVSTDYQLTLKLKCCQHVTNTQHLLTRSMNFNFLTSPDGQLTKVLRIRIPLGHSDIDLMCWLTKLEFTTGLDSFSALKITTTLKSLAINHNRTIICSIHQPSQKIIESFQQIILLSRGRIIFNGSLDDAKVFFQR